MFRALSGALLFCRLYGGLLSDSSSAFLADWNVESSKRWSVNGLERERVGMKAGFKDQLLNGLTN